MSVPKVVVAISGGGRTLLNLLRYSEKERAFEIAGVISSSDKCKGNAMATDRGIPLFIGSFSPKFKNETTSNLKDWLTEVKPDLIALAGFLKPFPILENYIDRIVNIHPALLPKHGGPGMYGNRVHCAVLESREKESGATIHMVTEKYDEGAILAQARVDISSLNTAEEIAKVVFEAECDLYPQTIRKFLEKKLSPDKPFLYDFKCEGEK